MALQQAAGGVNSWSLVRTASLPAFTNAADFTISGWFYVGSGVFIKDFFLIQVSLGDAFGTGQYVWLGTKADGATLELEIYNGVTFADTFGTVLTIPGWWHLALVKFGTTYTVYVSSENNATDAAVALTTTSTATFTIGQFGPVITSQNGLVNVKVWTAALTPAEIRADRDSLNLAKTASVHLQSNLDVAGDYSDSSGNGRTWTAQATIAALVPSALTTVADPTPLVPANTTSAAAVELGPLSNTITKRIDAAGTTATVWYKYTALAGDDVVGIFAFGDLVTYTPTLAIFSPDDATAYLSIAALNKPVQFPVTVGQVYYLRVTSNAGNPRPATLAISGLKAPVLTVVRGAFLINDDTSSFPAALLSATDGSVRRFVLNFPVGEAGIGLLTTTTAGRFLFHDNVNARLVLADKALTVLATITITQSGTPLQISRNQTTTFYVGAPGAGGNAASIRTLSAAGVYGPTTWTLPQAGLTALAPNGAETILYNAGQGGSVGAAVKRWDLVNSVMLSDLVAGVASHTIPDLLVLGDDSIVALYDQGSTDTFVRRYDAAGATLNTYSFGVANGATVPRLCHALDDPTSIWLWIHQTSGNSRFVNIRISDGVLLSDFTSAEYEGGAFQPAATATPTRFGHSQSCPIVMAAEIALSPCPAGA